MKTTILRTLDELTPVGTAEEALGSPVGMTVLILLILLLIAALTVIVIRVRKKNAKAADEEKPDGKTDGETT